MKYLSSQLSIFLRERGVRRNLGMFFRFLLVLVLMVVLYSILFHYLMQYEGRSYSWITGLYWTLTVMTTLGFGDITFTSDPGKLFSVVVLMTGVLCLLVMLPFAFIQYVYAPWLEAQKKGTVPRGAPAGLKGHIIVVGVSPVALDLVNDLPVTASTACCSPEIPRALSICWIRAITSSSAIMTMELYISASMWAKPPC